MGSPSYQGPWTARAKGCDTWLAEHKVVVSATTASLISTFAGFPLDSLKSRLQSSRESLSIPRLAADVVREEGIGGLWRGFPLPLITISIVRTISFTIYTSTKRILNSHPANPTLPDEFTQNQTQTAGASGSKPWMDMRMDMFNQDKSLGDVGLTSLIAGGASGAVVCLGSAPFELVKVRRQLEYQIYRDTHPQVILPPTTPPTSLSTPTPPPTRPYKPPTTLLAVRSIISTLGPLGLYTGFRLHFIRDTLGTALYFAEYDTLRHILGRTINMDGGGGGRRGKEEQGDVPDWIEWLPKGLIPFLCGSLAGVSSWALIYPVDAIKTKAQQRALSGLPQRTALAQFMRLVKGPDERNPKPLLRGVARLYRGLGISMARSMLTHGLLWTIVDWAGEWIETKPVERFVRRHEL